MKHGRLGPDASTSMPGLHETLREDRGFAVGRAVAGQHAPVPLGDDPSCEAVCQ